MSQEQRRRLWAVEGQGAQDEPGTDVAAVEDAEVAVQAAPDRGGPVDRPGEQITLMGAVLASREVQRRPIVPPEWRDPKQAQQAVRIIAATVAHDVAYQVSRTPAYYLRAAWWAPFGVGRLVRRTVRYVGDAEAAPLRDYTVARHDVAAYLNLERVRDRHIRRRGLGVGALVLPAAAAVTAWLLFTPWAVWWLRLALLLAVLVPPLGLLGRPADKPIVDRVTYGRKFTKLTAEMVRSALTSIGLSTVKDPGALTFPPPGIHRDGPGWLARVNLPEGAEPVDVIERRGRLASALRLPVDQVWPAPGPEHAGQLDLWVGFLPSSKMRQPAWPLAAPTARTSVFDPHEFGTDERCRGVRTVLFARNFLVGGIPGSGKSYGARALLTIALLDPTCELIVCEYKGTADFGDIAALCSAYACGVSDAEFRTGLDVLRWGIAEAERRGQRIKRARERGEAPEGKVTPELAARSGSGLHPVVILLDEAHELFGDSTVGKEAAALAERLIKRGRALGIILIIATQIPDKTSLPPNIVRATAVRWCMAVSDHIVNDQVLGTGAHKRGVTATSYRPGIDAGWGVMTGLAEPTAVRSHFPDPATAAAIVARATELRGGRRVGAEDDHTAPARDYLIDVRVVITEAGQRGIHWQDLAPALAQAWPEAYAELTADAASALARAAGVESVDVKVRGTTLKGCRREAVEAAIAARELTAGPAGETGSGPETGSGNATDVATDPDQP